MIRTMFSLIVFTLANYCMASTPRIGIMLESNDIASMTRSSLDEKLCIISTIGDREELSFELYANNRSLRESAEAAKQMVADEIDLAVLPVVSDEAIAATTILREANIPFITSATSVSVIRKPNEGLSLFPQNSDQAKALAEHYMQNYSNRPVAVITDDGSVYSKQLSAQFLAQLRILNLTTDIEKYQVIGGSFERLPDLSGHVVFAAMFNPKIALLYLQMQKYEDVILIGPDSVGVRKEFLQIVGPQKDKENTKLIYLKNWDGIIRGKNKEDFWSVFYEGCRQQKTPTFVNAYVYDMVTLVLEWLSTAPDASALSTIRNLESESVINGQPIEFLDSGYRNSSYFFYEYNGGNSVSPLP